MAFSIVTVFSIFTIVWCSKQSGSFQVFVDLLNIYLVASFWLPLAQPQPLHLLYYCRYLLLDYLRREGLYLISFRRSSGLTNSSERIELIFFNLLIINKINLFFLTNCFFNIMLVGPDDAFPAFHWKLIFLSSYYLNGNSDHVSSCSDVFQTRDSPVQFKKSSGFESFPFCIQTWSQTLFPKCTAMCKCLSHTSWQFLWCIQTPWSKKAIGHIPEDVQTHCTKVGRCTRL